MRGEVGEEGACASNPLLYTPGHVCLGLLLGYPERDVRAMHEALCCQQDTNEAGPQHCDYASDLSAALHYIRSRSKHAVVEGTDQR